MGRGPSRCFGLRGAHEPQLPVAEGLHADPGSDGQHLHRDRKRCYSCQVTAENAAGDTAKISHSTTYSSFATKTENVKNHRETKPGATGVSAKLVSGKPIKVKAGSTAVIKVNVINSGTATSASTRLCGTVGKQVRKDLKPGACVTVAPVAPGQTTLAKLTAKALRKANGTYTLTVAVSGATKGSLIAKVRVAGRHRK